VHQSFTPASSPDPFDVIADAVGGLLGALVCVAIRGTQRATRDRAARRSRADVDG
jgi:VanZ family protein